MDYLKSFGVEIGKGNYSEEIIYCLVILYDRIFDDMSKLLKEYKLTPAKMNVLMIIKHQGNEKGISQVDLSQRLMVTTSNMTRVLAKLQRDGLIARGNVKDDLRIKTIRITPKGSNLLDRVWPAYTKELQRLTDGLDLEKKKLLSSVFTEWMSSIIKK